MKGGSIMEQKKYSGKEFTMNVLNALALGVVVTLIPGALLGELVKALLPVFPQGQLIIQATQVANTLMGAIIGLMVGQFFKFTPIQTGALALAVLFAGGVATFNPDVKGIIFSGTGDIITMGLTAALGAAVILWIDNKAKAYSIIVIPTVLLVVVGGAGRLALPYIKTLTTLLGQGIGTLLTLQPVIMCLLLAVIFCMLIVSPFTTVGIAVAISLSGVGSGAANLGICAAGFGLAIAGWKVNPKGTAIAHFIGSPKMSMANVLAKPKILLPMMCTSAVLGVLAALLNIQGTPQSAGFGFSGLVGPINALNLAEGGWSVMNIVIVTLIFVVAPIALNIVFVHLFEKVLKWIQPEDYKLTV